MKYELLDRQPMIPKNWENKGTKEIGLVIPTLDLELSINIAGTWYFEIPDIACN